MFRLFFAFLLGTVTLPSGASLGGFASQVKSAGSLGSVISKATAKGPVTRGWGSLTGVLLGVQVMAFTCAETSRLGKAAYL